MSKVFATPEARLIVRAILAGLAVAATALLSGGVLTWAAVSAAGTAGLWAGLEYITPLNKLVGLGK